MRKVFLDKLPKKGKNIEWQNCVGYNVRFIYDDTEGEIKIINYIKNRQRLTIEYEDKLFDIHSSSFKNCLLGKLLNKYTGDFKIRVGISIKDERRDMLITDNAYKQVECKKNRNGKIYRYTENEKWYKYKCNKCGWDDGWIREGHLLHGRGCACCHSLVSVLGINTIWDTDRWMCDLGVSEEDAKKYTSMSNQKISVECPECGEIKSIIVSNLKITASISCQCNDNFSYPEKFMYSVLKQLDVNFYTQYSPKYLKRKRSDFYLPDYNLIIETDGMLGHEGGIAYKKSNLLIEDQIKVDKWKDVQHLKYGVKTIRINCFKSDMKYIKNNILSSELNNVFDLSKIDWEVCERFALKNIAKQICDYWNNKEECETTNNLSVYFNTSRNTIVKYLKKGTYLGWCIYNSKDEKIKSYKRSINRNKNNYGKKVSVFIGDVLLGVFNSLAELEKESDNIFGVNLNKTSISKVCLGKQKSHKGFTFKYIDESQQIAS